MKPDKLIIENSVDPDQLASSAGLVFLTPL